MILLGSGVVSGPFLDFTLNGLLIGLDEQFIIHKWARARALDLALDRALDLDLDRALDLDLDRALDRASENFWQEILATPDLYSLILDFICDIFALMPRAQWWEALRVRFLPKIPQRITIFDEAMWKQVENNFKKGNVNETDIYFAAWQLLFDAWLYVFGFHNSPDESIFRHLADLTREVDEPPLRIAHCIRDLAYGDESRTDDLISMVKSDNPQYRAIFEACFWRPALKENIKRVSKERKVTPNGIQNNEQQ